MTAVSLAIIGATIVLASFISGVFGMAGGMVLLGVLLVYFDVATAMVLFSILQITANGWRALHWRRYVLWPIFYWYLAGSVLAFAAMRMGVVLVAVGAPLRLFHRRAQLVGRPGPRPLVGRLFAVDADRVPTPIRARSRVDGRRS